MHPTVEYVAYDHRGSRLEQPAQGSGGCREHCIVTCRMQQTLELA